MSSFEEYARKMWPKAAVSFDLRDENYVATVARFSDLSGAFKYIKVIALVTGEHRHCIFCEKSTVSESYMVHDVLWESVVGWGDCGEVCVDCLQKRLGRQLTNADFTDVPINHKRLSKKAE